MKLFINERRQIENAVIKMAPVNLVVVFLLISLQTVKAAHTSSKSCSSNISPRQSCFIGQMLRMILKIVQCEVNKKDLSTSTQLKSSQDIAAPTLSSNSSLTAKELQSPIDLCTITPSAKEAQLNIYQEQPQLHIDGSSTLLSSAAQPITTSIGSQMSSYSDVPDYLILTDQGVFRKSSVPIGLSSGNEIPHYLPAVPKYQLFTPQSNSESTSTYSNVPNNKQGHGSVLFAVNNMRQALPAVTKPPPFSTIKELNKFADMHLQLKQSDGCLPIALY